MWTLADDLEHALAHRDPRDWYVFEAASWALAAQRMPAERRRALWLEPLPAVELAEPSAQGAALRVRVGRRVVPHRAARPPGTLRAGPRALRGGPRRRFHPVPARRPRRRGAARRRNERDGRAERGRLRSDHRRQPGRKDASRRVDTAIALSLTTEEFLSLLSENVEIAQGIFRLMLDRRGGAGLAHGAARQHSGRRSSARSSTANSSRWTPCCCSSRARCSSVRRRRSWSASPAIARPVTLNAGVDPLPAAAPRCW